MSTTRKKAALSETEAGFQAAVIEYATLRGWRVYHTHNSQHSAKGFPDLVMLRDDHLIFAELKSERGKVSEAQADWLRALPLTGAEVYLWRPSAWQQIERVLM